ncbi:unnamed protein product [Bursaphelenchus xylophilus]|uniref:Cysteine-rich DPF motif domain-containing protein 1 n=1 Tax=Bursaphelenchus xylophilus TaxID=6326 RepID=A0A1I7RI15_BURXY|nr:unnamed protein product [Bursaphelenchus xylophilus]CAD5225942.1 unnamed protein product [Bursaphelenchus xylophilus]CAG9115225.1 unnamed protein product [Bursaphelenchus xylophilus]CAG9115227.1 unnamed protein product [Bursaphelenchus xylophilus]
MDEDKEKEALDDKERRKKNLEEKAQQRPDDRLQFTCCVCGLAELTKYGKLEHKTISTHEEVFYIPDPFVPYDVHKVDFRVSDFVIFGSKCSICQSPVCVSKACSLFYNSTYCLYCVEREHHRFPKEIINDLQKRFSQMAKNSEGQVEIQKEKEQTTKEGEVQDQ